MLPLSLYLLAWLRLRLKQLPKQRIEFLFFYFHLTCMIAYVAGPEGFGPS